METGLRRKKILEIIQSSGNCITGSKLATMLNVERQVVLEDIALLRASGLNIAATPSGYMMISAVNKKRPARVFTCSHQTPEQTEKELMIMVENGGLVRDVIIEHPIYGEITGMLMLSTSDDVKNIMERLKSKDSRPLSSTTGGIHMHTVEAETEEALEKIEIALREEGLLA